MKKQTFANIDSKKDFYHGILIGVVFAVFGFLGILAANYWFYYQETGSIGGLSFVIAFLAICGALFLYCFNILKK